MKVLYFSFILVLLSAASLIGQAVQTNDRGYTLGADDAISINVSQVPELDAKSLGAVRIDHQGNIRLPLVGRLEASGLTVEGLEKEIGRRLSSMMTSPEVTVSVAEYRSHPVSVLGAVRNPGVYQVSGQKNLFEVLSLAGGLNQDASNCVKITRPISMGSLPLPKVGLDASGQFSVAELNVRDLMDAKTPAENIPVLANDVITVPKADMVYVVGSVHKAGGFPLTEREQISVLQAVSLAEGLDKVANAKSARILREQHPGAPRTELPVNVADILEGRANDLALQANDILFIPNSMAKSASMRALEAAIQAGTGIAIWGR